MAGDYDEAMLTLGTTALAVAGLVAAPAGALVGRHPEDGPDIDLRIAVEDDAVRVRMTMNIAFVWELVEFDWARPPRFSEPEERALETKLVDYYREHNRVAVDGIFVSPVLSAFEVVELEHPGGSTQDGGVGPVGVLSRVGVRLELDYPLKVSALEVALRWGAYVPDFARATTEEVPPKDVPCELSAGGLVAYLVFSEAEPEQIWRAPDVSPEARFLAVPAFRTAGDVDLWLVPVWLGLAAGLLVWSLLGRDPRARLLRRAAPIAALGLAPVVALGGHLELRLGARGELPSEGQALAAFRPLHANIYRAFDYTRESDIYDALARSVHGGLLDQLYNEVYRGLVMQEQGGAVSRVRAVRPIETEVLQIGSDGGDAVSFEVDARWQVDGSVFHWGHTHTRTNEYRAQYTVVAAEAGWRISGSRTLEQFRVESAPGTGEREVTSQDLPGGGP